MQITKTKWFLPAIVVGATGIFFVAMWAGGLGTGKSVSFALGMLSVATVFVLGGRSETIRGMRGDGTDERFRQIALEATAVSCCVLVVAILVGYIVELTRGHEYGTFLWLLLIFAVSYVVSFVVLRLRR
jgi:hypothetical protein